MEIQQQAMKGFLLPFHKALLQTLIELQIKTWKLYRRIFSTEMAM